MTFQKLHQFEGDSIEGETVLLSQEFFKPVYTNTEMLFKCTGGFGCGMHLSGTAVYGSFPDGEHCRISIHDIEGVLIKEDDNG